MGIQSRIVSGPTQLRYGAMASKRQIFFMPFILAAISQLVGGCLKVGPDFTKPPAAVSSNWLEAADERVKREPANYRAWWHAFNDPGLNIVIDRAYRENVSLRVAAVRVLEAGPSSASQWEIFTRKPSS